jgi:predicted transcriptional regulator
MSEYFSKKNHNLSELLFRYMHESNLSEIELAHKIGVHFDILESWLNGEDILPYQYVFKIIRIFDLTDEAQKEMLRLTNHLDEIDTKNPSFKKLLNQHLEEKKFNNNELAKKIGVPRITVWRWCNGIIKRPACKNVMEIVKALGLTDKERDILRLSAGCWPLGYMATAPDEKLNEKRDKPEWVPIPGIPISHPSQFFGQTEVLKRIRRAWQHPTVLQHVAIIGARRSGKTSLLKYLQHIALTPATELRPEQPQGWHNWQPVNFKFVFIDFQRIAMAKPESLLRNILKQLNLEVPEPCNLINFSELLEKLDKPTIFLMDEIGAGLTAPALDRSFWANMRSLGSIGQLGLVITAHESVTTLAQEYGKESPFFNIFGHTMHIGPLLESEARDLINSFSYSLTAGDIDWLLEKSGRWPALLQLLCDERIYALEENDTTDNWKIKALKRIEPFLYLLKI